MPTLTTSNDIELGTTISFDVHPSSILGNGFNKMKALAILDGDTAMQWIDVPSMHANVYPTIADMVDDDPYSYYYLKLRGVDGQITCVGIPWIVKESIEVHESLTLKLTIENVKQADVSAIRDSLSANGFRAVDIKVM